MIELYNDYVVTMDPYNYILQKRKVTESGKDIGTEYFKTVGYYWDIGGCLKRFHDELIRDSLATDQKLSLDEAMKICHEVNQRFEKWFKDNALFTEA